MSKSAASRGILNNRGLIAAAAVGAALAFAAAPARAQSGAPITVGVITELSGSYSFFGTACRQGIEYAQKKIAAEGGALGRPLNFKIVDDQTNPAQAVAAARSFDVQDNVLALTGPTSSDIALAVYGYAEQNKVPFVVPVAAFAQLTKPGTHYTFRIESDAVGWGYAAAKFIAGQKPGAKVALMYNDIALARAIVAGIKYQAPKENISIVSDILFPQGSNDATVQAAQIVAAQPDYVYLATVGAFDVTATNQLLDLGIKPEQIIHNVGTTTTLLGYGQRSVGLIYGSFFDTNLDNVTPAGRAFADDYLQTVGRIPGYIENFCYNTPYIIKAALEKAGSVDREKFRDAMSALNMVEPTSGVPISFDKNGARKEYMYYMQLTGVAPPKSYTAKKLFYIEWAPETLPVYDLVK
ncbi:MAG TPA: ABC transporter substrate-binding protein [Xanthobacteraceae bacterium]|jgi:branched-chain amino acid transport system substrate-binding protein|nr:ABC transporter substrate-binding protein [Xanthobacteraceae bacterium]